MSSAFTHNADVIDSRDVIARIEELESDLSAHHEQEVTDGITNLDFEEWLVAVRRDSSPAHCHECNEGVEELQELRRLADEASASPDWEYGESLINEEYFVTYIEELIDDCYEMPKGVKSGEWPWRHMQMDFEAAAEEAKQDYMEVTFFGNTFLIRA